MDDFGVNPYTVKVPGGLWDTSTEGRQDTWSRSNGIPYGFDSTISKCSAHHIPDCGQGKLISPSFQSHLASTQQAVFRAAVADVNSKLSGCIAWRPVLVTDTDYVLVIPTTGKEGKQ